jgi:hypothetical protein
MKESLKNSKGKKRRLVEKAVSRKLQKFGVNIFLLMKGASLRYF